MVSKKPVAFAKAAASAEPAKSAKAKKPKSLTYGKVHFKAMLYRGKWRFISKAEAELSKKKRLAKLAKLKAQGVEVKPEVSIDFTILFSSSNGYIAQVTCDRYTYNC